jgi:hypothetical protein
MTTDSAAEVDVARSITVPLGQAKAFDLFTARMTEFWPPEHSIGASPFEAVVRYGEQAEQMRAIFDSPVAGPTPSIVVPASRIRSDIGIHRGDGARRARAVRFVP